MPEGAASFVTLFFVLIIIAIPVAFIGYVFIAQAITIAQNLAGASQSAGSQLAQISSNVANAINSLLAPLGAKEYVTSTDIVNLAHKILPDMINHIVNSLLSFLGNLPKVFTSVIVFCFVFTALLRHNKSAIAFFGSLMPFDKKTSGKYFERSGLIVSASLRGQFIISFVTAIASAFVLIFLGLGQYFVLFTIIFTLLGMVPLGAGILMIPICIISMMTGNFWPGFIVLLVYLLIICNIDSVLRPHLIPKKANMIPAVVTLATFCGIYYFGVLGIIYGPLIVILLSTTADIYISSRKPEDAKAVVG